jgi:serine/threonine-protein kinase RsbW
MTAEKSSHKTIEIDSRKSHLQKVFDQLLTLARENGFSEDDIFAIHLSLEEALVNAVVHGNERNPDKKITVDYDISPDKFEVCVTDQGGGFEPDRVPDPRCGENIYKPSGRGLLLMNSYMDEVEYNQAGNSVTMRKFRN